jgi:hypothetical protein
MDLMVPLLNTARDQNYLKAPLLGSRSLLKSFQYLLRYRFHWYSAQDMRRGFGIETVPAHDFTHGFSATTALLYH